MKKKKQKKSNKTRSTYGYTACTWIRGSVKKRVDMFNKLRDKKAAQGYQKTDLANEKELTSGQKNYPDLQAIAKEE